jgi:hypothetical protein
MVDDLGQAARVFNDGQKLCRSSGIFQKTQPLV